MPASLRRLTDGVLPQAVITGSLSFAHIHALAEAHGQRGWEAWTYPLSVDLLTVAAYRRLVAAHRAKSATGLAWVWFLLALSASLAANVAVSRRDVVSIAVGVWPAVAFLGCTLLGHATAPPAAATANEPDNEPAGTATAHEPVTPEPADRSEPPAIAPPVAPAAPTAVLPAPASALDVPAPLLDFARRIAGEYRTATGRVIDLSTLQTRLGVAPALAGAVHQRITATT